MATKRLGQPNEVQWLRIRPHLTYREKSRKSVPDPEPVIGFRDFGARFFPHFRMIDVWGKLRVHFSHISKRVLVLASGVAVSRGTSKAKNQSL